MKKIPVLLALFLAVQFSCSAQKQPTNETRVEIETNYGKMVFKLYNETPLHRDNFVKLINDGYFNDLLFHRVIHHFMIQGGDPDSRHAAPGQRLGSGSPGYTVEAEINPKFFNKKGALAAARQGDQVNPEKRSSGSQFFIVQGEMYRPGQLDSLEVQLNNRRLQTVSQAIFRSNQARLAKLVQEGKRDSVDLLVAGLREQAMKQIQGEAAFRFTAEQREIYTTTGGYPSLDGSYTVFGELIEGFDVLDKIAAAKTDPFDRPETDVKMTVKILK